MRIAVLSDSHIPTRLGSFQGRVYEEIADSDLIVHAGDMVEMDALRDLERFAEVRAVRGNMDDISLRTSLPEKIVFEVEGFRIGVTHGSGAPFGITRRVLGEFEDGGPLPDIIIHGHSHVFNVEEKRDVLIINPGALVDRSFGILTITGMGEKPLFERVTF